MTNEKQPIESVPREMSLCKFEAFYHSVEKMEIYLRLANDLNKENEADKRKSSVARTTKNELISYLLTAVVPCYSAAEAAYHSIRNKEGKYWCNLCCDYRMLLPYFDCPLRDAEAYKRVETQYSKALVDFDRLVNALKTSGVKLDTSVLLARG